MEGYIKLYRKIIEDELYFAEKFTKIQAWIDLLLLSSYKKRTLFIRDNEISVNPGQICYSQLSLAQRWKWNPKTVNRFLRLLVKRKKADIKISKVTTIITILNWNKYQLYGEQNGQRRENRTETNNKVKNDKKDAFREEIIKKQYEMERIKNGIN